MRSAVMGAFLLALGGAACAPRYVRPVAPAGAYPHEGELHRPPKPHPLCEPALAAVPFDFSEVTVPVRVDEAGTLHIHRWPEGEAGAAVARVLLKCVFSPGTIGVMPAPAVGTVTVHRGGAFTQLITDFWTLGDVELPGGRCPSPEYPRAELESGVEGPVDLALTIDVEGRVAEANVVEATSDALGKAALRAAASCRMKPALHQGLRVPVRIPYSYRFLID